MASGSVRSEVGKKARRVFAIQGERQRHYQAIRRFVKALYFMLNFGEKEVDAAEPAITAHA